jgi:hypothetical protein
LLFAVRKNEAWKTLCGAARMLLPIKADLLVELIRVFNLVCFFGKRSGQNSRVNKNRKDTPTHTQLSVSHLGSVPPTRILPATSGRE